MAPLVIDRTKAHTAFYAYVAPYDASNPRVALKIEHTLRVAELAEEIARAQGFTPAGIDLCWLAGLLHDIGRFEQLRRWNTFNDRASADHAAIGVDVLFEGASHLDDPALVNVVAAARADDDAFVAHAREAGALAAFAPEAASDPAASALIRAAVGYHSAFRLPDELDVRTHAVCDVVRDADKIDILRVTCTDDVQTVLGITEDELLASAVSPATEDAFFEHRCVRRDERTESADYLVALACFTYELVYPASLEIALDQGFIFQPFERPFGIERPFTNRATAQLMNRMDGHLRAWVDEQI
ncbi:MAG TPA: HD domain-containing protein [Candidatus Coprousia avicola]|nr:HD domain-containing protein [Candidatus Coprousia avicola]